MTNSPTPVQRLLRIRSTKFGLFLLLTSFGFAPGTRAGVTLPDLGHLYLVEHFIQQAGGDDTLGIINCLNKVNHDMARITNESAPEKTSFTILFPQKTYTITRTLQTEFNRDTCRSPREYGYVPFLCSGAVNKDQKRKLNLIGLSTSSIGTAASNWTGFGVNAVVTHPLGSGDPAPGYRRMSPGDPAYASIASGVLSRIASTGVASNGDPVSPQFLTSPHYPTTGTNLPMLQAQTQVNPFQPELNGKPYRILSFRNHSTDGNILNFKNTHINVQGLGIRGLQSVYVKPPEGGGYFSGADGRYVAIYLENMISAEVENNVIENLYGDGILMVNNAISVFKTSGGTFTAQYRNEPLRIHDNVIKNVWGLHYIGTSSSYDDWGDGINMRGGQRAQIHHNIVVNRLEETRQFGRIGIAIAEYNRNHAVYRNMIGGYDRGIHIEQSLGGFEVARNRITATDTGMVIDGNYASAGVDFSLAPNNPSTFSLNYISNEGIPEKIGGANPFWIKIYPLRTFGFVGSSGNEIQVHHGSRVADNFFKIVKTQVYEGRGAYWGNSGFQSVRPNVGGPGFRRYHLGIAPIFGLKATCNRFEGIPGQGGVSLYKTALFAKNTFRGMRCEGCPTPSAPVLSLYNWVESGWGNQFDDPTQYVSPAGSALCRLHGACSTLTAPTGGEEPVDCRSTMGQ